jgi:hypothetical protein
MTTASDLWFRIAIEEYDHGHKTLRKFVEFVPRNHCIPGGFHA